MNIATLTGWASVFGNRDLHGDTIKRGAFARTLSNGGSTRPFLWQHDQARPIGTVELVERDYGLWAIASVLLDVRQGKECAALVRMGAIKGLSIGYRVVKDSIDGRQRVLEEVELFEVSAVTIGANQRALISTVDDAKVPTKAAEAAIDRMGRQIHKIQSAVGCPIASARSDVDELRDAIAGLQHSIRQATRVARAA